MSLARNRDSELLQAFEGCFEGDEYKGEIDDDLFLAQVSAVVIRASQPLTVVKPSTLYLHLGCSAGGA